MIMMLDGVDVELLIKVLEKAEMYALFASFAKTMKKQRYILIKQPYCVYMAVLFFRQNI